MRHLFFTIVLTIFALISACDSGGDTDMAAGDETGFNPKAWYGKCRADIAKMHPNIARIDESMSSGPFNLPDAYGVKLVNFTFEDSWSDGLIRSVTLIWANGVTIQTAAGKFGVNPEGIKPLKAPRYWEYTIDKNGIRFFKVRLSDKDTEESPVTTAWIVYAND